MTEYDVILIVNRLIDVLFAVVSAILLFSVIGFSVESFNPIYAFLSRANYEESSDKKFFIFHCVRIVVVLILLILFRMSPIPQYIIIILRKLVGL